MSTTTRIASRTRLTSRIALLAALALAACNRPQVAPDTSVPLTDTPVAEAAIDVPVSSDVSDVSDVAADAATDAAHDAVVEDTANCEGDGGCWNCRPTTTPQYLNQCTTSNCARFDNRTRIPGWDGGALPPIL